MNKEEKKKPIPVFKKKKTTIVKDNRNTYFNDEIAKFKDEIAKFKASISMEVDRQLAEKLDTVISKIEELPTRVWGGKWRMINFEEQALDSLRNLENLAKKIGLKDGLKIGFWIALWLFVGRIGEILVVEIIKSLG